MGLTILLFLAVVGQPAFETTVELIGPESGVVRTVVRSPGEDLRGLVRVPDGWRLEAIPFETTVTAEADGWFRVSVPIPADSADDLDFAAVIHPPPGYRVRDPFPTRVEAEGAGVRMSLPAPPSFLRFRLAPADAWLPGPVALVEIAVLGLFLGLALFGAFRLTRSR